MSVPSSENIARAVCSDHWDGERYASSLFKGENTSVSRLAITPLEDSWDLFRKRVENPPTRTLMQIGEINVGKMQRIAKEHDNNTNLTVEPKPLPGYDSHAEIPQKITRGLANKIIKELVKHNPPSQEVVLFHRPRN